MGFVQEWSEETGLITLKSTKTRGMAPWTVTIRPDYEEGTFEVTDSPQFVQRAKDVDTLTKIIVDTPGLTQNAISKQAGMKKSRLVGLLKDGIGRAWEERKDGPSLRYFPLVPVSGNNPGTGKSETDASLSELCRLCRVPRAGWIDELWDVRHSPTSREGAMRVRPRTDRNHAAIVRELRQLGAQVQSLAAIGDGVPDLLVAWRGRLFLFEVKDPLQPPSRRKLTDAEKVWHERWKPHVAVIETSEQALAAMEAE